MEEMNINTVEVVDIQFRPGQKVYFFAPGDLKLKQGDHVIIDTARGAEFGICAGSNHRIPERDVVSPLRSVLRLANEQDEKTIAENRAKEKRAFELCSQKIAEHGLDMQLVSAECAFDGSKILFFFTADERVDFRELVKQLASAFHTRIELRQIGVRDKAKMVGGLGICGRPFCCATFLDDFQPVSIKMAKTQSLSLNPTKISGTCGRLMCCLKYEQDAYEDLIKNSPKLDSFVDTPQGRGTIVELSLLRQKVKVRLEESPETLVTCGNDEIEVYRSGKAKKTDPPIPADWAPISGSKSSRRLEPLDKPFRFEPVRLRSEMPQEPEEEEIEAPAEEKTEQRQSNRNRRKKKGNKPAQDRPQQEKPQQEKTQPEKPQEPKSEGAEGGKPKGKPHYHRRRRPNKKPE